MPRWFERERAFIEMCRAGSPPPPPVGSKPCSKCKEIKPYEDFPRLSANRDGLAYHCRPCATEYYRAYRARKKTKTPPVAASGVSSSNRKKDK